MAWLLQGIGFVILIVCAVLLIEHKQSTDTSTAPHTTMKESHMIVRSPAFNHEERIPAKYTCDGEDTVPPIAIDAIPEGTRSLTIIMDDPDAPGGTWDHWLIYNLPGDHSRIGEDDGKYGTEGTNSWGNLGYGGPCPPTGEHRYRVKVFALDTLLDLAAGASKQELLSAMDGHVIESTTLMGRYSRIISP